MNRNPAILISISVSQYHTATNGKWINFVFQQSSIHVLGCVCISSTHMFFNSKCLLYLALSGRAINFQLPTTILVHLATQQTIIYSLNKGNLVSSNRQILFREKLFFFLSAFILPPLFNFYDDMFSIGELVASGYACFMHDRNCLYDVVDVASLFYPKRCK